METEVRLVARGMVLVLMDPEMPRAGGNGEIGSAAHRIGGIHRAVGPCREMGADRRGEMSSGGKADHADLVRIDVISGGMSAWRCKARIKSTKFAAISARVAF